MTSEGTASASVVLGSAGCGVLGPRTAPLLAEAGQGAMGGRTREAQMTAATGSPEQVLQVPRDGTSELALGHKHRPWLVRRMPSTEPSPVCTTDAVLTPFSAGVTRDDHPRRHSNFSGLKLLALLFGFQVGWGGPS